ncbi:tetratricopeptide repeat protein [Microcoleus sp. FACHB-1515]|uniref:tetratricopeptide repeat protein n=1 Tax=Cyanophyceae TaxID=3028117 RepID=UPI001682DACE|nr:tetratricopeptide repeat protein [Microcoleus sp. FACHB-1515]MBD2088996.1 tetratricopeptide repeat protein [Microcoleus sp. FACHB-1515]
MNPPNLDTPTTHWLASAIEAIEQGQQLCEQKQWSEVARLCQQAIVSLEPGTATAYRLMGWALQEQGHLSEAELFYAKAIAIQPDLPETHARLGSLYAAQLRWPDAIACYQHAIAIDADFVGAYLKLGEAWQQQGDLAQAAISFHEAFQRQPLLVSPHDHWQLGNTLQQQGNLAAAIAAYRRALTQDQHLLPAWISLSEVLQQQGRIQDAIACCQDAIARHPDQAALETQLGNLLASQGQVEDAIVLHRRASDRCGWQQVDRSYRFTYNWFTHNLLHWWPLLQPYVNQPDLRFLEVGSFEGMSACWLLDHILTHPSARLTTIDPIYPPAFNHNLVQTRSVAKVNSLTGSSHDLLPMLPAEAFQVIYIDGCHLAKHVEQDARLAWPLLQAGGLLIFDDYLWSDSQFPHDDPRLGIDAFLNSVRDRFELVHQHYQLVIRKR